MAPYNPYQYIDAGDIQESTITVKKLREAVLGQMLTSGPGTNASFMPTPNEVSNILDGLTSAVTNGRVIDFGLWPNEFIQITSKRAGPMYSQAALGHPFSGPWILLHSWFGEVKGDYLTSPDHVAYSAYLISPFPDKKTGTLACTFEAVEIDGISLKSTGDFMLGIGDRVTLYPNAHSDPEYKGYVCDVAAAHKRFLGSPLWDGFKHLTDENSACNVIDPIMTALLMLNTNGIKTETVVAPEKVNNARIKAHKKPIPPYRRVTSDVYVTTIMARRTRNVPAGEGHHASPIAHIRKGHWRNYEKGTKTFIRDTLVNVDEATRANFVRTHYVMKPE